MIKIMDRKLIVGLEIGTSKVITLIGEILPDNIINIIGVGNYPSFGVDKGHVNDLELAVKCVQNSVYQAELMADCHVTSVYLALSGKYISYQNEIGIVPILEEEVTQKDIYNILYTAKSVRIRDEHSILHIIPQNYSIDQQDGIKNPIGLSGIRLQTRVHLITYHNDIAKNFIKIVERCKLKVNQLIFSGLANSYAVLTADERELGVCLVDIGGGTIDIVIYISGVLQCTKVIPYAGNIVTKDISYAFNISLTDAENIKIFHGCTIKTIIDKNKSLEIPSIGGNASRILQLYDLAEIIEPRYTELLNMINVEIVQLQEQLRKKSLNYHLSAGIVLTGGASQLVGLIDYAQEIFNTQVRIGYPLNIVGLVDRVKKPDCSTVVGLLNYSKDLNLNDKQKIKRYTLVSNVFKKIFNWFKKEF